MAGAELLGAQEHRACGVSPVPLVPQESSILPLQSAKCGSLLQNLLKKQPFSRKESIIKKDLRRRSKVFQSSIKD
ncbi:hypothetical protein AB986_11325 [Alkalihalobacillus macyae]|uniref:Uncharacterized protein n=1 Tax=Guptibacillus hwajinpoensis TaxID=208199 RepID=A0A0J6CTY7_9BACL|nr:hypothetical protein AB986_11325 [Alkalihalobacillus macyae]